MGLDPQYIPIGSLQDYFVNKDDGFPLAAGKVYFYADQARTIKKYVYQISGTPPNYTYTVLPNPLILSSVGTFEDNSGNDVIPYYKPYDVNGNLELYYVAVYDSEDVLQFTREGQPNISINQDENVNIANYIPNGQFLEHLDLPDDGLIPTSVTDFSIPIAFGNWFYSGTANSTSIDYVTFNREGAALENPTANPRYTLHVVCEDPDATDAYKVIEVRFPNVNKFASNDLEYTFSFSSKSNTGSTTSINFDLRKYFGIGGSPDVVTTIKSKVVLDSFHTTSIPFVFGTNENYVIGDNDDDYVSLEISLPVGFIYDLEFTDFLLTDGNVSISLYPQITQSQTTSESVFGSLPVPAYDGSDLDLPLKLTKNGVAVDYSVVGDVYKSVLDSREGCFLCNGATIDPTDYSTEGVPYSRLFDRLYNPSKLMCKFGTGREYLTATYYNAPGADIVKFNNTPGVGTVTDEGAIPTGFSFLTTSVGINSCPFKSYWSAGDNYIYVINIGAGRSKNPPTIGTTTMTVAVIREGNIPVVPNWTQPATPLIREIVGLGIASPAACPAGSYFDISSTTTDYYVWFQVDGVGTDPAVAGRTGIKVNYKSGLANEFLVEAINKTLSGLNISMVTCTAASTITAGSFFNIYNYNSDHYYVWYTIDGVGVDPVISSATGIKTALLTGDTSTIVATKTITEVNKLYYGLPDMRGLFLRMRDDNAGVDAGKTNRQDRGDGTGGDAVGTLQEFEVESHHHEFHNSGFFDDGWSTQLHIQISHEPDADSSMTMYYTGGKETRPVNMSVNYFIKY